MAKSGMWLLAAALAACGCGGSLTAPDAVQQRPQPAADVATISGRIYEGGGPVQAPIGEAIVELNEADGSSAAVLSDADGFYRLPARRGAVTITVSKDGYEAKQWQFDLLNDTVLNFSLQRR